MQALLLKVYEEYFHFYQYKHRKPLNWGAKLKIVKEETLNKPKVVEAEENEGMSTIKASFNNYLNEQALSLKPMNSFQPNTY